VWKNILAFNLGYHQKLGTFEYSRRSRTLVGIRAYLFEYAVS